MDYMEIAKYIGTLLVGLAAGLSINIASNKDSSKNKTTQKKNIVFGDQSGRDINKKP